MSVSVNACQFISELVVVAYLGIVEAAKRVFYAHFATKSESKRFRAWLIRQWSDDEHQKS